jgi:CheY-like chemotaxis protein
MLQSLGYSVTGETDPQRALKVFEEREEPFDLVISDLTMPGLSGLELTDRIKALSPDQPVILCTGFDQGLSGEEAASRGISLIVQKPFIASEFSRIIHSCMTRVHQAGTDS